MQDDSRLRLEKPSHHPRAAQYVRMSRDLQKYSTQNQADAIAAYAAQRNIKIVRTYTDEGRSGLKFERRLALQQLIRDVRSDRADFELILVYDVSRWGRFQDADESAYYEFICKEAGIKVLYCAEEFTNDGSLTSTIVKNMKRVMAGEYSRELSTKVFVGQCRLAKLGFFRGGPPGYGLRRYLLHEGRTLKAQLEPGQRKSLQTDRVVLGPGPPFEVEIVRRIFDWFVTHKMRASHIAFKLNAERTLNSTGKPWNVQNILDLVTNERYIGNIVFNRSSYKLQQRRVVNPPEMWIRNDGAFEGIIAPEIFAAAQEIATDRRVSRNGQRASIRLEASKRENESLSRTLKAAARDASDPGALGKRFTSLAALQALAGNQVAPRPPLTANSDPKSIVNETAAAIAAHVEKFGCRTRFNETTRLLIVNDLLISFGCTRPKFSGPALQWRVRLGQFPKSDFTVVIRMDKSNEQVQAYYLLPTVELVRSSNRPLYISGGVFAGAGRYESLEALCQVLANDGVAA